MQHDNSIAGLAMTLSKANKIEVTVSGEVSMCDSKNRKINIARMKATPLGKMLANGLVMHEIGHMNYSDVPKPPGLLGTLANVIEDVRTELLTISERPGTRFNLKAVTKHYADKGTFQPTDISDVFAGKALSYSRDRFLGHDSLKKDELNCNKELELVFSTVFVKEFENILNEIPKLKNNKGSVDVAQKICDLIINPPVPPQQPPQGQEQGQQGQGQSSSNGNQQGSQGQQGKPNKSKTGNKSGGNGAGGTTLTEQDIQDALAKDSNFGDISKLMQDEMNSMKDNTSPLAPKIVKSNSSNVKLDEVAAISAASKMRARMIGLLESINNKPTSYGLNGRKISSSRLEKIAIGDPRIFKRKVEQKAANTAIAILIDYSGSMAGEREIVCKPAAFALHNALRGLKGVEVTSIGFNGLRVCCIADFGTKPKSQSFNERSTDGTPMDKALWAARLALSSRNEKRKIVFVLTDGEPDCGSTTKSTTKELLKQGIEIAAIGIQHSGVRDFWDNNRVINNIAELPKAMFDVMNELLKGKGQSL